MTANRLMPHRRSPRLPRADAAVVRHVGGGPGGGEPGSPRLSGGARGVRPSGPVRWRPPDPAASVDVTAPFLGQPVRRRADQRSIATTRCAGAALSRTPPPNRDITLRELLGLGRSDIADQEVEARPYPRLHDDPLAGSPVPPAERDRPLLPWLSNLFFEHNGELKEDADDARAEVLERRSKHNVTLPGPDTANFPNGAFTLPKGRAYIETSPVTFFGKSGNNSFAAQYNWEFLFRYGLTDDLEFRFFSSGYAVTLSRKPPTSGFSPLVFDFKYHMWDENLDKHIPAAGVEICILTPFGSNYFNGGTQPSIALLLDHTLPFDILLEHNFGLTGIEDTFGGAVYEFSTSRRCRTGVQGLRDLHARVPELGGAAADADLPAAHRQSRPDSHARGGGSAVRQLLRLRQETRPGHGRARLPVELVEAPGLLRQLQLGSYPGLPLDARPDGVHRRLLIASRVPRTTDLSRVIARSSRARSTSSCGSPACPRRVR